MLFLGTCGTDSDNLITGGVTSGITWTPDSAGGGVLQIDLPAGGTCAGDDEGGADYSWYADLYLLRGRCGRKIHIEVDGQASKYSEANGSLYVINPIANPLIMSAPGGGEECAADDWVVISGTNPCDVYAGCADASWGYSVLIAVAGTISNSPAMSTTITVTLV